MADIVFPEVIEFGAQTRNGWVHQSGVSVLSLSGNLLLNPLTSKGTVGQGAISIHPRALGAVMRAMVGEVVRSDPSARAAVAEALRTALYELEYGATFSPEDDAPPTMNPL